MVSYILFELANKQWHNYQKLQAPLLGDVDAFVSELLQGETSLNVIQDLSGVIGMLGLTQSYEVFRNLITTEQPGRCDDGNFRNHHRVRRRCFQSIQIKQAGESPACFIFRIEP